MATRTTEMKTLGEAGEDGRAKMERAYSVVSLLPYIPSISRMVHAALGKDQSSCEALPCQRLKVIGPAHYLSLSF